MDADVKLIFRWGTVPYVEALRRSDISKKDVVKRFGTWVVTKYGVECLAHYYPIEAKRLCEGDGGYTWARHMAEKNWPIMEDFMHAWAFGKGYHQPTRHR